MDQPWRQICLSLLSLIVLTACAGLGGGLPSSELLLTRHLEAVFPAGDIAARPFISMSGRLLIEDFGVDAPISLKMKAPDKRLFSATVWGQEVLRGCSGGECWAQELNQPIKRLQGGELALMQELADSYRLQRLQRYYRSIKTTGSQQFNGVPAYEVQLVRNNGSKDRWYFAQESGLWLGGVWQLPRDMGGAQITQIFDGYRKVDGFYVATRITEIAPNQTSFIVIDEINFAPIPDELFKPKHLP